MTPDWRQIESENRGLRVGSQTLLGEGWNSRVFLVNQELVFRFPKRTDVWAELHREVALLEWVSDRLPLTVPRYVSVAEHSPAGSFGYAAYRHLPGSALALDGLSPERRLAVLAEIADFVRALHELVPPDSLRGWCLPKEDEFEVAKECLASAEHRIIPELQPDEARELRDQFDTYIRTNRFNAKPVLLHADLSRDHILVENQAVASVLDFGDANLGDADYDFMYLFVEFGWLAASQAARHYGHPNLDQLASKVHYFAIVDQIDTILNGRGLALEGQEDEAWKRLRALLKR